jgi:hypothetical protein
MLITFLYLLEISLWTWTTSNSVYYICIYQGTYRKQGNSILIKFDKGLNSLLNTNQLIYIMC